MERLSNTRNLIKFSHYSTCLILPKKMLETLNWQQGDAVRVALDVGGKRLVVEKESSKRLPETISAAQTEPVVAHAEGFLPIPELVD